jgi:hypothetical protein
MDGLRGVKAGVYIAGLRHYHDNINGFLLTKCFRMTEVRSVCKR